MKPTKRKAFNFLRSYFDVLNQIPEDKDKLAFLTSIINKQFLDENPKDLEFVAKLSYESQRHAIEKSVKGWKTANKTEIDGSVLGSIGGDPKGSIGGDPMSDPKEVQEEEQVQEEEIKKEPKFNFRKSLIALGVKDEVAKEWLNVRKKGKAVNSELAFKRLVTELEKSKLTPNRCIEECVVKSWKGFEASWIKEIEVKENAPKGVPFQKQYC